MMEYTIARVVTMMCGALLITAILPPVQSLFDDSESSELQEQSERLCMMIDTFYNSEADEMVLSMDSVLPGGTTVSMSGFIVTISDDDAEYISDTRYRMVPDRDGYGTNDILRFTKAGDTVMIETV